jgi:hypothetical protein
MMNKLAYPPPTAFGLLEKFHSWRPEQVQAINRSELIQPAVCLPRSPHRAREVPGGRSTAELAVTSLGLTVEVLDGDTSQPGGYSSELGMCRRTSHKARHSIKAVRRCHESQGLGSLLQMRNNALFSYLEGAHGTANDQMQTLRQGVHPDAPMA